MRSATLVRATRHIFLIEDKPSGLQRFAEPVTKVDHGELEGGRPQLRTLTAPLRPVSKQRSFISESDSPAVRQRGHNAAKRYPRDPEGDEPSARTK